MKKNLCSIGLFLCLFFFLTVGICLPSSNRSTKPEAVKGPVLIDKLSSQSFNLQLVYSDVAAQQVEVLEATPSKLSLNELTYTSFTEGFIPSDKNEILLNSINDYRQLRELEPIGYYYNYISTATYDFVSLSTGLDGLYILNRLTGDLSTPHYSTPYADERQYIYHIVEGEEMIYILSAKANSYEAFWYALDPETFQITEAKRVSPPLTAIHRNQYALDSDGTAYFVASEGLQVLTEADSSMITLDFTPQEVYYKNDQLYAFSTSGLFLSYAIIGPDLELSQSGRVNLPNKEVLLVDSILEDQLLYTITYDSTHPLYRNYLTIYNLNTSEMVYCLALKENQELALLGLLSSP